MATEFRTVEGVITKTNATGLQINGAWFNWSNLPHKVGNTERLKALNPQKGQHVRVTYEPGNRGSGGFIESLEILDTGGPAPAGPAAVAAGAWDPETVKRVTRLACLEHAARLLAPRERYRPADWFVVAQTAAEYALGELPFDKAQDRMVELARQRGDTSLASVAGGAR